MKDKHTTYNEADLKAQIEELKLQLEEANDALQAIQSGQVDALIVKNDNGPQLYTLKSADQTYRVFIENMNEGAITLNADGIILYANSRFAEMTGYPLSNIIGKELHSMVPENKRESFEQLIREAWHSETKSERLLLSSNHEEIPFLLSLKILQLEEGTELSIILTDLSVQKKAEKELKIKNELLEAAHQATAQLNLELEKKVSERTQDLFTSREHFKFLADNIPVIVWTALPTGELNYFNKRWYEYTGTTFEASKDWGWEEVVHPEDIDRCIQTWRASIITGKAYSIEYRYKRGYDGMYRWHHGHALPFRNENNDIIAWFGISTDIEEQKMAMQKKDDFISVVSHELKTPLTSVKAYIQLAMAYRLQPIPAAVNKFIDKADQFTRKLENLINDIMDVSKIHAGKLQFSVDAVDVNQLLSNCVENSKLLYPAKKFTINTGEQKVAKANYERLEQVILNLINNAVKYAPGSDRIILSALLENNTVRISITDFGIGLTEDQKDLIFNRFYRIASETNTVSGLGMGLYISSEIIKAHGGRMGVESEVGKGSTFYFVIPALNK